MKLNVKQAREMISYIKQNIEIKEWEEKLLDSFAGHMNNRGFISPKQSHEILEIYERSTGGGIVHKKRI